MSDFVKIVCTDVGEHASVALATFTVGEDGTFDSMTTRNAALTGGPPAGSEVSAFEQTFAAPTHAVVEAASRRADFDGRRSWRFLCPRCGRDKPVSEATFAKLLPAYVAARQNALDLSRLP